MSVITPILDTLLHDVLGRRSAASALRSLDETVTPVRPAVMLYPAQEDAVLDVRRANVPDLPKALARSGAQPTANAGLQSGATAPGGVQARLSPVAQVIAGVLGRFPAPPSTLRILAPLIQQQAAVPPALLATQLQASVNDSGLFYEAHLARWYRGSLPLAQLAREPQMQLASATRALIAGNNAMVPAASALNIASVSPAAAAPGTALANSSAAAATVLLDVAAGTDSRMSAASSPGSLYSAAGKAVPQGVPQVIPQAVPQTVAQGLPAVSQASASAALVSGADLSASGPAAAGQAADSAAVSRGMPEINDALQGLLRHQLELLSVPVLRWEGDVWAGIFMQLMIHLPQSAGDDEPESDGDGAGDVESEVTLDLQSLGMLKVKLHLHNDRLGLILATSSQDCLQHLEAGHEALAARLRKCGFIAPAIQMKMLGSEETR